MAKIANKLVSKTDKKVVGLLKDQSHLIEKLQSSYKEKLASSRQELLEQVNQTQAISQCKIGKI